MFEEKREKRENVETECSLAKSQLLQSPKTTKRQKMFYYFRFLFAQVNQFGRTRAEALKREYRLQQISIRGTFSP